MAEMDWAGFSEEELNRIRLQEDGRIEDAKKEDDIFEKAGKNKGKRKSRNQNSLGIRNISVDSDESRLKETTTEIPSKYPNGLVQLKINEEGHVLQIVENFNKIKKISPTIQDDVNDANEESSVTKLQNENCEPKAIEFSLVNDNINSKKISNLEKFQIRQKQMEEQNKQRRALLTQAIVDRQKKTQAENEKLLYIQKEMVKLDNLVSGDVSILRDHIEQASMEFNEAQKRYKKAEDEYVQAKIELFRRLDRKEQLTEHLCAIIEQNELRKAQMLIKLMKELEMEIVADEDLDDNSHLILPQLCSLSEATGGCSTLKNPQCSYNSSAKNDLSNNCSSGEINDGTKSIVSTTPDNTENLSSQQEIANTHDDAIQKDSNS